MTATTTSRPFRRRLVVSTLATGAGNVWAIVVGLVLLPVLVRGLGTAGLGWWALLQTMSASTGWLSLADLGLRVSTVRAVAERAANDDRAAARAVASTSVALYGVVALGAGALLALAGPVALGAVFSVPDAMATVWRAAVLALALQVVAELVGVGAQASIEGWQRVDLARGLDALRRTLVAVAAGATALATNRLDATALAAAVASAVAAVVALAAFARVNGGFDRVDRAVVQRLVSYGSTVAALNATGVLHRTMDRIIVGIALGPRAVAVVEIVTQLQNGAMAVMTSSAYVVSSAAPWVEQRDASRLRELLVSGTRWCVLVTVPAVVGLAAIGPAFVAVWTGRTPDDIVVLCALAAAAVALSAPLQVASLLLQGVGRASTVLRAAALAVGVNLVASIALVGRLGIAGVFWASLIGGLVLVAPLAAGACGLVGERVGTLARESMRPSVVPALVCALSAGAVLAAPLGSLATVGWGAIAIAAGFGLGVAVDPATRREVRGLLALVAPG